MQQLIQPCETFHHGDTELAFIIPRLLELSMSLCLIHLYETVCLKVCHVKLSFTSSL